MILFLACERDSCDEISKNPSSEILFFNFEATISFSSFVRIADPSTLNRRSIRVLTLFTF